MKSFGYAILSAALLSTVLLLVCLNNSAEHNKIKTELYLGLSDSKQTFPIEKWNLFKRNKLEKVIDGYTELDGNGFWRNSKGKGFYQYSTVIVYLHDDSKIEAQKIDSIIKLVKLEFEQESVLRIEQKVVAEF